MEGGAQEPVAEGAALVAEGAAAVGADEAVTEGAAPVAEGAAPVAEGAAGGGANAAVAEGMATAAQGEGAPAPTAEPELFNVGQIVVGTAHKYKDDYHGVRAVITRVRSKDYKVELLDGTRKGQVHKYLHCNVRLAEPVPQPALTTFFAPGAGPAAGAVPAQVTPPMPDPGSEDEGMQAIEDLFQEI